MRIAAAATVLLLAACGGGEAPAGTDASVDRAASDGTSMDMGSAPADAADASAGDLGRDVVHSNMDVALDDADGGLDEAAVDAGSDDVFIDPGMCGPSIRRCLCACGGTCLNTCIAADLDCSVCIYIAAQRCCPDPSRLLDDCIATNHCDDDACIALHCASENAVFQACFATSQRSVPSCLGEVRACLGPDYPMIRCVVP